MGKHGVCNCNVDYEVYQQKFTQEQRTLAEVRSKQTDAVGDHSSSFAACEGRVDCGVCSLRQYRLWCVICASVWTVVCVLCASVDYGMCSVHHILHAWTDVLFVCGRYCQHVPAPKLHSGFRLTPDF